MALRLAYKTSSVRLFAARWSSTFSGGERFGPVAPNRNVVERSSVAGATRMQIGKKELVKRVAERAGVEIKVTDAVVSKLLDTIVETVTEGEKIAIPGFGTYEAKTRSPRTGRNPRTGEPLQIPAKRVPYFSAGKTFKDKVNGDK
uniref:DNA-binding protein HU-beta n=1 Tax=Tetraselmis sp. GSL018 TaxID=582737 RepID=A0A061RDM9_9CHLO|mmetsp:Transcript_5447/g.13294  ORF Transcript_5447/g.13294 Transcript_5447/m.13294 type:complete len:145 (-) Transcript_5447:159-593(-)|eukprot:CAMPEP_0177591414 /NCGR_PEP_ID=MMETSP0419_2-20121207/7985_1 /TAXON_ID=582737 /ORGANISM="Tetraselmis sp., Strain GSL018" /LENGTH=144 /DNA_ID=CAMNT_0019082155 /DNA_START=92 /DNA_END=526 /DNA_ORIENTATION=+